MKDIFNLVYFCKKIIWVATWCSV